MYAHNRYLLHCTVCSMQFFWWLERAYLRVACISCKGGNSAKIWLHCIPLHNLLCKSSVMVCYSLHLCSLCFLHAVVCCTAMHYKLCSVGGERQSGTMQSVECSHLMQFRRENGRCKQEQKCPSPPVINQPPAHLLHLLHWGHEQLQLCPQTFSSARQKCPICSEKSDLDCKLHPPSAFPLLSGHLDQGTIRRFSFSSVHTLSFLHWCPHI